MLRGAKNFKLVLGAFEILSSLKISYTKNELFYFGSAKGQSQEFVELFGCKEGNLSFRI